MSTELIQAPKHVGFILDGNRRWAKFHNLPAYEGHIFGYNALKEVIFASFDNNIEYVSIYAFSTENWRRGEGEVGKLMKLAYQVFKKDLKKYIDRGIQIKVLGSEEGLDQKLIDAARTAEQKTASFKNNKTLCICFNYGGQKEIADAAAKCVKDGLKAEEINETAIASRLYAPEIPPIDIVVRTSGEQRLSNFMLWRIAYSELFFIEKYWPDMNADDISVIINEYSMRQRRHGG